MIPGLSGEPILHQAVDGRSEIPFGPWFDEELGKSAVTKELLVAVGLERVFRWSLLFADNENRSAMVGGGRP